MIHLTTVQAAAATIAMLSFAVQPIVAEVERPEPLVLPQAVEPAVFAVGVELVPLAIGSSLLGCLAKSIYRIQYRGTALTWREDALGFLSAAIMSLLTVGIAYEWFIPLVKLTHSPGIVIAIGGATGVLADTMIPFVHKLWSHWTGSRFGARCDTDREDADR